jgi:lysophospholipid acyltransferase 5
VFKRLKFLGNKILSQVATLLFLAIWHGLHSGYIICFSMEFIIVNVEKQVPQPHTHWGFWKGRVLS